MSAAPFVIDHHIYWPNDGWYQVQRRTEGGEFEVCQGGQSCEVSPGNYIVINHTTGERFRNVKVPGDDSSSSPVAINGNVISWSGDGWYQVQNAVSYEHICEGGSECRVEPGSYHVINLTTGTRYENIVVKPDDADSGDGSSEQSITGSVFESSPIAHEQFASVYERVDNPPVDPAVVEEVVQALNDFSLRVSQLLAEQRPDENHASSGYSIASALTLLRAAASDEVDAALASVTNTDVVDKDALHKAMNRIALDLESRINEELELRVVNRLFTQKDLVFNTAFLDIAAGQYGAPPTAIDFSENNAEALDLINTWVASQTNDQIPQLLAEVSAETVAMIINAFMFDAFWQPVFFNQSDQVFNNVGGGQSSVAQFGGIAILDAYTDAEVTSVDIPYRGGQVSMLVVQPNDFLEYESTFNYAGIAALRSAMSQQLVSLTMPEWKTESELDPQALLSQEGFPGSPMPLDNLLEADSPGRLYDLETIHQAVIEVNSSGTRAAAATSVGVQPDSNTFTPPSTPININRPFLFFLIDNPTGLILFNGRTVAL